MNANTQQADATAALIATATHVLSNPPQKSRRAVLEEKRAQLAARIKQLQQQESVKERKIDARRMIMLGRCVTAWAKRDWNFSMSLRGELEKFVTRPRDRELLNLTIQTEKKNVG